MITMAQEELLYGSIWGPQTKIGPGSLSSVSVGSAVGMLLPTEPKVALEAATGAAGSALLTAKATTGPGTASRKERPRSRSQSRGKSAKAKQGENWLHDA